jgi:hypothetical protein
LSPTEFLRRRHGPTVATAAPAPAAHDAPAYLAPHATNQGKQLGKSQVRLMVRVQLSIDKVDASSVTDEWINGLFDRYDKDRSGLMDDAEWDSLAAMLKEEVAKIGTAEPAFGQVPLQQQGFVVEAAATGAAGATDEERQHSRQYGHSSKAQQAGTAGDGHSMACCAAPPSKRHGMTDPDGGLATLKQENDDLKAALGAITSENAQLKVRGETLAAALQTENEKLKTALAERDKWGPASGPAPALDLDEAALLKAELEKIRYGDPDPATPARPKPAPVEAATTAAVEEAEPPVPATPAAAEPATEAPAVVAPPTPTPTPAPV